MSEFNQILSHACNEWALPLTAQQLSMMEAYAVLLAQENERTNLTAITDMREMAALHFADSLLPLALLPMRGSCIDIGTGAGFPGVPLCIAAPMLSVTLLDSHGKRIEFIRSSQKKIAFKAEILGMRAETAGQDAQFREHYDIAVSRALAPLRILAELMLPLVRVGGIAIAWKGPRIYEEMREAQNALEMLNADIQLFERELPWGKRCIAIMKKRAATDKKYPRKPGMPEKRPL